MQSMAWDGMGREKGMCASEGGTEGVREGGREARMEGLHELAQNGYYRILCNNKKVKNIEHD